MIHAAAAFLAAASCRAHRITHPGSFLRTRRYDVAVVDSYSAGETAGSIRIAGSVIACGLRVGAERTGNLQTAIRIRGIVNASSPNDLVGSDTFRYPSIQGA